MSNIQYQYRQWRYLSRVDAMFQRVLSKVRAKFSAVKLWNSTTSASIANQGIRPCNKIIWMELNHIRGFVGLRRYEGEGVLKIDPLNVAY